MQGPTGTPSFYPGDNVEILSGGTLGGTITSAAKISLDGTTGDLGEPTTPLYLGPGNGAAGKGILTFPPEPNANPQTSVEVPTPGGYAFNMWMSITPTDSGGIGAEYTYVICNEEDCDVTTNPFCKTQNDVGPPAIDNTVCQTSTSGGAASLYFMPGDTLSIQAFNSEVGMVENPVVLRWSMDYAISAPNIP